MQRKIPAFLEFRKMTAEAEARALIGMIRQSYPAGTPWKLITSETARRLQITERRVMAFWSREVRKPLAEEMDRLRAYAAARTGEKQETARHVVHAAASQFETIADRLGAIDADLYRPQIDGYRRLAREARALLGGPAA